MTGTSAHGQEPVDRWPAGQHRDLRDGLSRFLDPDAGLREALFRAEHGDLADALDSRLDTEAGLAAILPPLTSAASPPPPSLQLHEAEHVPVLTRQEQASANTTSVIDIAMVDDNPIILDNAAAWVMADKNDIRVVATAATVGALLDGPGRRAGVVLLDIDLGDGTIVDDNVAAILAAGPAVLILSASDQPIAVRRAVRAGARGYALKSEPADRIRAAIREVAAGGDWVSQRLAYIFATDDATDMPALSHQERRSLQLYATGMPLKSVARKMGISEETVKQYLGRVREKYAKAGRAAPAKLERRADAVPEFAVEETPL